MDPADVFGNKSVALKLLAKQKELRQRDENVKIYKETYDPSLPGALKRYQELHMKIDRETLEELGYGTCINEWNNFTGIDDMLIPYFEQDEEIMKMLGYPFVDGSMNGDILNSPFLDVGIVSMTTKQIMKLSSLHINKDRPFVIIASSLS